MFEKIKEIIEAEDFNPCFGELGKYKIYKNDGCEGCFFDKATYCAYEQFMLSVRRMEEEG